MSGPSTFWECTMPKICTLPALASSLMVSVVRKRVE